MKVFRHVNDSAYHYYVQHTGVTVLWYPAMTWQHEVTEGTQGKLLAEGTADRVMAEVREVLPGDLLTEIGKYPWPTAADGRGERGETNDLEWSGTQRASDTAPPVDALAESLP